MIRNLRAKLDSLPKTEIKQQKDSVKDYDCTVYTNEFSINEGLDSFAQCDISYLKTACKIIDDSNIKPEDIVFFDTETTGLAGGTGTVAFLVGAGRLEGNQFIVRQFFMNDYHQETSVLNEFKRTLAGAKAVATYNGKSFDAPLLKTRSILNRININLDDFIHFDLLHACRRLYKMRLERMKLTDIEEHILGMERHDDIPGSEIPDIFFRYFKYGESALLKKVIEHNLNDIVSLVKISGVLAETYAAPHALEYNEDALCVARTLLQTGDLEGASSIFETLNDVLFDAKAELAYINKKAGEYERALALFKQLSESTRFSIEYDIEIAKIYEHKLRNYEQAVNYSKTAREKIISNRLLGRSLDIMDDVEKRILRLNKKIGRK